jgi:hypothetical protein
MWSQNEDRASLRGMLQARGPGHRRNLSVLHDRHIIHAHSDDLRCGTGRPTDTRKERSMTCIPFRLSSCAAFIGPCPLTLLAPFHRTACPCTDQSAAARRCLGRSATRSTSGLRRQDSRSGLLDDPSRTGYRGFRAVCGDPRCAASLPARGRACAPAAAQQLKAKIAV